MRSELQTGETSEASLTSPHKCPPQRTDGASSLKGPNVPLPKDAVHCLNKQTSLGDLFLFIHQQGHRGASAVAGNMGWKTSHAAPLQNCELMEDSKEPHTDGSVPVLSIGKGDHVQTFQIILPATVHLHIEFFFVCSSTKL